MSGTAEMRSLSCVAEWSQFFHVWQNSHNSLKIHIEPLATVNCSWGLKPLRAFFSGKASVMHAEQSTISQLLESWAYSLRHIQKEHLQRQSFVGDNRYRAECIPDTWL